MKIPFALALMIPASVFAASPIDGTWKPDLATMKTDAKPTVYKLKDGKFSCESCKPAYTVKADGTDQPVKGRAYADMIAVTVTDPSNVTVTGKLAGKPSFSSALVVSPDGNSLTSTFKQMLGTEPVAGVQTATRKGKLGKGDAPVTGKWDFSAAPTTLNDATTTVTYLMSPDGLQMKWNGQQYDAKFDGKQVPYSNDPGNTMASVKKVSDHEIIETDYRMGKKVEESDSKVSADGKTIMVIDKDLVRGSKTTYTMNKLS